MFYGEYAHTLDRKGRLIIPSKFREALKEHYVESKNLIAWNFYNPKNPIEQVDIIITYDLSPSDIKSVQTSSGEILILSKESLIRMKRKSGRPQDLQDVHALENL